MLKNMKIGRRLIVVFAVVILISSLAGILGISLLLTTDKQYSDAMVDYGFAQGDIGNVGITFYHNRSTILQVITTTDNTERAKYVKIIEADDAAMDTSMAAVKKSLRGSEEEQLYANLEAALAQFRTDRDNVIKTNETVKGQQILNIFNGDCTKSFNAFSAVFNELLGIKTTIGNQLSTDLTAESGWFALLMGTIIVVSIVIAMVVATIVSRGISKPVAEVARAADEMSRGNYDVEVTFQARDEIGVLAQSMRTMMTTTKAVLNDTVRALDEIGGGNFNVSATVEFVGVFDGIYKAMTRILASLSDAMNQISVASQQVESGADQVSSGAQALSQGATEQASSIEELSASIAEISEQVKNTANNANQARDQANRTGTSVQDSNEQMKKMIDAMSNISQKSGEIGKIIKTIDDIAFQTNILALNAAVEAARAGAAGKGFAVVADEVRNLAGKSAEAAKNTTALIEETVTAVENGTHIASSTAQAMLGVVGGATEVIGLITSIADASDEQANSITQITLGIDQISSVVQTNSATSEESAAASEELLGQAQMLKTLVGRFTINEKLLSGNVYN